MGRRDKEWLLQCCAAKQYCPTSGNGVTSPIFVLDKMTTFCMRLRAARLAAGMMDDATFAEKLGVPKKTVGQWMKQAEADMPARHLIDIAKVLKTRPMWLMDGRERIVFLMVGELSERELLQHFGELTPKNKALVRELLHAVIRTQEG